MLKLGPDEEPRYSKLEIQLCDLLQVTTGHNMEEQLCDWHLLNKKAAARQLNLHVNLTVPTDANGLMMMEPDTPVTQLNTPE